MRKNSPACFQGKNGFQNCRIIKKETKTYNISSKADFENLFRDYWKRIYFICYSKTSNKEASEEMVQDIFISLWNRKDDLAITSSIENYLIKAAKLKVIDYYRMQSSAKNQTVVGCLSCDDLQIGQNCLQYNESLEKFLEQDLELTISHLPVQCQKVYRLSREEQMSIAEIAESLNISPKTVKNHLTKALGFIREKIPVDFCALITALSLSKLFL